MDEKITLIKDDFKFCEEMLQKVSRTFAINIGFLKGDIYKTVLCGYLFCRIIDTIEDSSKISPVDKIKALNLWNEFFPFKENWNEKYEIFKGFLKDKPNNYDELLLENGERVFNCFQDVNKDLINCVVNPIVTMSSGMALFQNKFKNGINFYQLKDLKELEGYCYYVAGTVGEMLTALFLEEYKFISEDNKKIMEKNKIAFGLGLQLTNIIKDVKVDLNRDWIYFPKSLMEEANLNIDTFFNNENKDKSMVVIEKLILHAALQLDKAFEYCMALPRNYSVRMFHLLPLHFAIYTLKEAKTQLENLPQWQVKISRKTVAKLILKTKMSFFSNTIQKQIYNKARSVIS